VLPTTKNDKPKELKVTDKRIFTPDGDLREEFRNEIKPASDPMAARPAAPPAETPPEKKADKKEPPREERRRTIADKAQNPGTAFTDFVEPLIAQAYMSLGLLRNPYQPKPQIDAAAARQMIEIITMLKEKTEGNLTADEDDFLSTHLGELKLAFVQRTKSL
jgi:Domain of unknown function (DUF1844)